MFRNRIFTGLLIGLFATMTLAPASLGARGACIAAWETGTVESHQRAELQAQGQRFTPDCGQDCDQAMKDALASYERAVIQATGQRLTGVSIAQEEWLERAELQAQGQRFIETPAFACEGGESVLA
jgi:hypothetical protein